VLNSDDERALVGLLVGIMDREEWVLENSYTLTSTYSLYGLCHAPGIALFLLLYLLLQDIKTSSDTHLESKTSTFVGLLAYERDYKGITRLQLDYLLWSKFHTLLLPSPMVS